MIPDYLRSKLKTRRLNLVLPEGDDERILTAARCLVSEGFARPILISAVPQVLSARLVAAGCATKDFEVRTPGESAHFDSYIRQIVGSRTNMNERLARRLLTRPLYLGGAMVAAGHAAAMVAGVAHPTPRVIEASLMTIGLKNGVGLLSSFDVIIPRDTAKNLSRILIFSDCSVTIDPSVDQLAAIAIASAESARALLNSEPRVALLSFSTLGSASHARASKVRSAVDIVRERRPDIMIDGEMQADTALSKEVACLKGQGSSSVAGQANVLIFPDLDSGNIAEKLVKHICCATVIGSVLQGLTKPVANLSRGADVTEIVQTAIMTLAIASEQPVIGPH